MQSNGPGPCHFFNAIWHEQIQHGLQMFCCIRNLNCHGVCCNIRNFTAHDFRYIHNVPASVCFCRNFYKHQFPADDLLLRKSAQLYDINQFIQLFFNLLEHIFIAVHHDCNTGNGWIIRNSNSKTFNIAGLMMSHIIIRDEELRSQFKSRDNTSGNLNPLSIAANKAAFLCGEEWLDQLKSYLDGNFRFVDEFLKEKLPEAVFRIPDATYLAWVDLSLCLPDVDDLPLFFAREAGVLLEGGDRLFVADAKGFVRLNLAMPRSLLAEGMKRIAEAVSRHRK